jgi:ATP-dependent Clp protease ATP-binding subunit ClpB
VHLAENGYDSSYGARPLKRLIQTTIVNLLSSAILKGEIKGDEKVELFLKKAKGEEAQILFKIV